MPVRGGALLSLVALVVASGCPLPPPGEEPEPPTEEPAPQEPFVFTVSASDYSYEPVAGVELAVGEQVGLTGQDGSYEFQLDAGPPVQLDHHEELGVVDSTLTCADQEHLWVWTGSDTEWIYGTVELTVQGLVDPAGFELAWVYVAGTEPYTYVSRFTVQGSWLTEQEPGVWGATFRVSPTSQWEIVASEARPDGTAGLARHSGGHGLDADQTIAVEVVLEDAPGGVQPWDGQVDPAVSWIVLEERIEVMGTGVLLPVLTAEPDGQPRDLPVLDGHLDVLEYQAALTFEAPECDSQGLGATLDPLFPPDTLSLPELPPPPVLAVEGAPERPELAWTVQDPDSIYAYADVWDEAGEEHRSDWFVRVRPGCGDRVAWPVFLPSIGDTDRLSVYVSASGDGWAGWCSVTVDP